MVVRQATKGLCDSRESGYLVLWCLVALLSFFPNAAIAQAGRSVEVLDPQGDVGTAFLDILRARVSELDDDKILFEVDLGSSVSTTPNDYLMYLWSLDTDRNAETGSRHDGIGAEFNLRVAYDPDPTHGGAYGWHGWIDVMSGVAPTTEVHDIDHSGTTVTMIVETGHIDNTTSFHFTAHTWYGGEGDMAPNGSFGTFPASSALELLLFEPEVSGYTVTLNGVQEGAPGPPKWNWGDGTPEEHHWFPHTHIYSSPGTYTITVTAYDAYGHHVARTKWVTVGHGAVPDAPTGVTGTDGSYSDRITITWNSVGEATYYEVYRSGSETGSFSKVGDTSATSYDDAGVPTCQLYWYKVKTCNAAGCSILSSSDSGYAGVAPDIPTGVNVSDGTYDDKIRITWNPVGEDLLFYNVHRSASQEGSYFEIGETTSTSFDDTQVIPAKTYWYRVNAVNTCGGGSWSSPDSGYARGVVPRLPTVLVLVNEELYPQIQGSLTVFAGDLSFDGYDVALETVSGNASPPSIKALIKSYYDRGGLAGAILVGDIKAAYFEAHTGDLSDPEALEIHIALDATDMYYMDLDGEWEHVSKPDICEDAPPNVAVCYAGDSCKTFINEYIVYFDEEREWGYSTIENKNQYKIEIWVARIMGHNLHIAGKNEAQIINEYLTWNHKYRTGKYTVSDKAYVCDAINNPALNQGLDCAGIFADILTQGHISKEQYSRHLQAPGGSELLYLLSHSGPKRHTFHVSPEPLMADELQALKKTSIFYLLNCCSSCRWDHYVSNPADPNYLGGLYVFDKSHSDGDYGMAAIGFAGTGGFNFLEYFTDFLEADHQGGYGEAFKYWFNKNLEHIFQIWNYVFLGDPTIRPHLQQGNTVDDHTVLLDAGWNMVSSLNGGSPSDLFGVTAYRWNPATHNWDTPSLIEPEKGYWVKLPSSRTVTDFGSEVTSAVIIDISAKGWYQVSAPWFYPKSAIKVIKGAMEQSWADAVADGWVRDTIYAYKATDGAYTMPTTINPWYGVWLKALVDGLTLRLLVAAGTPVSAGFAPIRGPKALVVPADLPPIPPTPSLGATDLEFGNYPNPITDVYTTTFAVKGAGAAFVEALKVQIFDLSGRLVYEQEESGASLDWHTENDYGEVLANGVYLYKMYALVNGQWIESETKKLAILR